MTKKILFSVALCVFCCAGVPTYIYAQVKTKTSHKTSHKFTKEEKEKFSVVYDYAYKNSFDGTKSMQKHLPSINIPEKRLGEIFNAKLYNTKITLTQQEQTEMDKLTSLVEKDKKIYDNELNKQLLAQNLTPKKYEEMLKEYTQNRFFQSEIYEITKKIKKQNLRNSTK